jgi:hypothetical protein
MAVHISNLLQKRLYEILTQDLELMELVTGVFDVVPDEQSFPFIMIGKDTLNDFGSHSTSGFEGSCDVDVYSQAHGLKEAKEIASKVYTLLHEIDLALEGFPTLSFRCDMLDIFKEPDNRTIRALLRFKLLIGGN